jgi:hypothetical protein
MRFYGPLTSGTMTEASFCQSYKVGAPGLGADADVTDGGVVTHVAASGPGGPSVGAGVTANTTTKTVGIAAIRTGVAVTASASAHGSSARSSRAQSVATRFATLINTET